MIIEIILGIVLVILALALYFCFKFAMIILKTQEVIEASLDILDERYQNMSEVLKRPLFFQNAEVRSVLQDIDHSRNAVHRIAISLVNNFEDDKTNEG